MRHTQGREASVLTLQPSDLDVIGERVRRARQTRGWTQKDLERESGVSQGQISQIEHGQVERPGTPTMTRLAAALGIPLSDLTMDDYPPSEHDLPPDLREQIAALPVDLRGLVGQLVSQGNRLPDTAEGRAAFVEAIRVATIYLKGIASEQEST